MSEEPGYEERLAQLAVAAGIAPSYRDFYGNEHFASIETRRRILISMGLPADTLDEIEQSLQRLTTAQWSRLLPPVYVAQLEGALTVRFSVPAQNDGKTLLWQVFAESGAAFSGESRVGDAPLIDTREVDGRCYELRELYLKADLPFGYHTFTCEVLDSEIPAATMRYILTPSQCFVPDDVRATGRRLFGVAVQLYSLRDADDWGVGDFGCLRKFVDHLAHTGVDLVGLNPLHELSPADAGASSPYSPSSRLTLNPIYLDINAIPDLAESERARALYYHPELVVARAEARDRDIIDYAPIKAAKRRILEACFDSFQQHHLASDTERSRDYQSFIAVGGATLARLCTYNILAERFAAEGIWSWQQWPAEYRDVNSATVIDFATEHHSELRFFAYLQWEMERQLQVVQASCREMQLGLYCDLAVGVDGASADTWARPELFAKGIGVGAPPDPMSLEGQGWGLVPYSPLALYEDGYAEFAALLRANMRRSGALRIDHAMALLRLYWIPDGLPAGEGAYVHYRVDDLFGILALESHRQKCLVIGEDLGTLPDGFRERLAAADLFSYRLTRFERVDGGGFIPPEHYPQMALASFGTHDLPPLAGFWFGDDIIARDQIGWVHNREAEEDERTRERTRLVDALVHAGDLKPEIAEPFWQPPNQDQDLTELTIAAYRFVARAPSIIAMIQAEDLIGVRTSINIPGTTNQHPNWRRRLPVNVEELTHDARTQRILAMMREIRPHFS